MITGIAERLRRISPRPQSVFRCNRKELRIRVGGGQPVVFLSSYPRSGNTWTRYLLADVFAQSSGIDTRKEPIGSAEVVPDVYCDAIKGVNRRVQVPALLVKTHADARQIERWLTRQGRAHARHLCLYRRPEDALVSYYHFRAGDPGYRRFQSDIDAFCLDHVEDWNRFLAGYCRLRRGAPQRVHFVSYESLADDGVNVLAAAIGWLGRTLQASVNIDPDQIRLAFDNHAFNKLRANELRRGADPGQLFFRSGRSGEGRRQLRPGTVNTIRRETADWNGEADSYLVRPTRVRIAAAA